ILATLSAVLFYFLYKVIVYPYYLGPLRNLPRPKNTLKHIYEVYKNKSKGNTEYFLQLSLKYGPVVHLYSNTVLLNNLSYKKYWMTNKFKKSRFYSAFDIAGLSSLFSTTNKDHHSKIKKLVLPAFSQKTLSNIEGTIYDIASQGLVNYIHAELRNGTTEVFDMFHLFHCSTFDVISELVFGSNFDTINDQQKAKYYFDIIKKTQKALFMRVLVPIYKFLPLPMEEVLGKIVQQNIDLRVNNHKSDILQSLLDSEDPETGEKLSNEQIKTESMTLLVAGMDSTANSLTWALYELLKNLEAYELVEKEILEEFPNFNEPITVDKVKSNCKYLEAAILESMRLYPAVAGGMERVVPEDGITVDGYFLPDNTIISHPIYNQHHDPKNWKNPKSYDIQRWIGEDKEKNKAQLMTFGAGPRSCIARDLAWNEIILVFANIIRHFR
ncbi:cytochrome P450, partial [Conidiobolus coronatus NRRL 28638]